MCQFKYTHHSCGHTLPKLEEPDDPSCKLCVPVLVALKYYHDQPMQVCIENSFQQRPIRMPRPCRPIGPASLRDTEDTAHTHAQDLTHFEGIMEQLEVNVAERKYIQELALRPNQTSKRSTNMSIPLTHFNPRKIQFIMELETWQHRPYQPPNITFNTVTWGCGGTGPGVQSDCLVGWTGQGILMYRHGVWNANPLHHWDSQSPPALGFLRIDYGDAPVLQLPERWRASATRTSIDIPMSTCLYAVLRGRVPGPLVYDDQGYLVPALGASGPDIPTGLHFPSRPPQVLVSPERSRHAPGRRHPAPWISSASITQAAGGSRPNETYKQRNNKTYKERYGQSRTEAGPSQPVDRAKITTRIKELPQRRASRSGNTTPASTAPAGVSQPVDSTHPIPGSTTTGTTASNVPPSNDTNIALGTIHESSPAASVEATNEDGEETIVFQPPRHRTPHPSKAEAETPASEGKKPIKPIPSRQNSTRGLSQSQHPNVNPPPPADDPAPEDILLFNMSSNILIGAEAQAPSHSPTQSPPPPQELVASQASTRTERPSLIQNIARSTSQMTQYAAQLNLTAQQQQVQVPGVEYTLNPTAEEFLPASSGEEE